MRATPQPTASVDECPPSGVIALFDTSIDAPDPAPLSVLAPAPAALSLPVPVPVPELSIPITITRALSAIPAAPIANDVIAFVDPDPRVHSPRLDASGLLALLAFLARIRASFRRALTMLVMLVTLVMLAALRIPALARLAVTRARTRTLRA
jgi:hypothetical protein